MKSIAIDMDNVIADVESHYIAWYAKKFGIVFSKDQLMGIPETEAFPDKDAVRGFLYTPGFFRTVPLMPGAQEAVKVLAVSFQVYIVSAAMEFPQSLPEKLDWLGEHFPFISWNQIIFCGDKSVICTDYMVDDHVKNLERFKGKGLLYHACHNININHYHRLHNWTEALQWFEKEKQ